MLLAFTAAAALSVTLQAGPGEVEARHRATLAERPGDIDARVGLAMVLLRRGDWQEALPLLQEVEGAAGENADFFHALAIAYRRSGDDERALQYYTRAKALSPADTDVSAGFENTVRAYGHAISLEGFGEQQDGGGTASGTLTATVRVTPRLHVESSVRLQDRLATRDLLAGGGVRWRAGRATTLDVQALAGPGNTTLARADASAAIIHYAGAFEWGLGVRALAFSGTGVAAVSPGLAWDVDRWRLDARYSYSRTRFDDSGQTAGDHSVLLRETWRTSRRLALVAAYAYGIESFERLTAERAGSFGATTLAAGLRVAAPSAELHATWEHQWRSNDLVVDRFTVSMTRFLP
jgi:tetratricopeptide (TPR) repeat protein